MVNFFTVKVPDMRSLGEFLVQKTKEKSPNDIISANFGSEKVDQDGIFFMKIYYISFLNDPNITFKKSYLGLVT